MLRPANTTANPSSAEKLLAWYDRHARVLPWRAKRDERADPYSVWLSEIMLQQTTVAAVKPYFEKFLARWPRVENLAAAPIEEIMQAWAGLGYYSRARNLHACATEVARAHGGRFPEDEESLRALPGIGPYTAAAIAAIAFGRRAAVVDGNVERVVTRLCAIAEPMPKAKRLVRAHVDKMTPAERPGDFAQAMMDLGATICSPKTPSCILCPFADIGAARAAGDAERYPVKAPKALRPVRFGAAFYLRRADGAVLVRTRPAKGLLGGMTEFPGSEWSAGFDVKTAREHAPVSAEWKERAGVVTHVFTHFELRLSVFCATAPAGAKALDGCRWAREDALGDEALPSVMRKVAAHAGAELKAR